MKRLSLPRCLRRLHQDERGTTAIEFGMVAAPFFLFAFAIMGIGLQFFTINALEHGVEAASRKIRTGQMQSGYEVSGVATDYTLDDFRELVCQEAGSYIDCGNKLVIHVSSAGEWSGVAVNTCLNNAGNLVPSAGNGSDSIQSRTGGSSQVVLVVACYEWELGGSLWQTFWNLMVTGAGGSGAPKTADKVVIQSIATFRTEPYS